MSKKDYRVRNWADYNKALINRGSITFWVNTETPKNWYSNEQKKAAGRPYLYSESAIEICIIIRILFNLPYRNCQGLLQSLFQLMNLPITAPSYTQICRRQKTLKMKLKHHVKGKIHVVVDATGLKIFGEGEWKVRQHGYSKHRMWRKLHIGIDVETKEIIMMELTENNIGESKLLRPLLDQYKSGYTKIGCDKGYDSYDCHEEVGRREAESAIEPQRKSKVRQRKAGNKQALVRDEVVRSIRKLGRKRWKKEIGYHKRSLVENTFFRYKKIFGSKLRSYTMENQMTEALVSCNLLNHFTRLGLPISTAK